MDKWSNKTKENTSFEEEEEEAAEEPEDEYQDESFLQFHRDARQSLYVDDLDDFDGAEGILPFP